MPIKKIFDIYKGYQTKDLPMIYDQLLEDPIPVSESRNQIEAMHLLSREYRLIPELRFKSITTPQQVAPAF